MATDRPFEELNLWQRIFLENWDKFAADYRQEHGESAPAHWQENVERMLSCGDIREGYYEYYCQDCGAMKKVGFTCKSRLCLRCFKVTVDEWLNQAKKVLFEGVVHRQVVLTVPKVIRPLILADEDFLKVYMDAGAKAVKELVEEWRRKKKIRVGIMAVLQLHGRAGNQNPHLHFVVSEGGIDKDKTWREVNYFDTKKLRKKWQYHVITALRKAIMGTEYETEWHGKLGSMFRQYPTGFDCDCMPESGPVERLVVYLCKYVSSPPISIRRIEGYDGQNVTYRYEDHLKGPMTETISAVEFIGRMIRHLPPKGFRMVRYYGIYARPIREKIHALVAGALKALVKRAEAMVQYFVKKLGRSSDTPASVDGADRSGSKVTEQFSKGPLRCPECGSVKMLLVRIWSKEAGMIYDIVKDGKNLVSGLGSLPMTKTENGGQTCCQMALAI
ncbi:MAG: transposase [Nitrospirae bacterium]|nr:transposase [Nitrospirota bacterium]